MNHPALSAILQESLLLFFLLGSSFALLLGLLFLLSPSLALRFAARNSRWLSLRRQTRPLELNHPVDGHLYRHHRPVGLFILLSSAYILYRFGFDYHHAHAVSALSPSPQHSALADWLLASLLWFLAPASVLFILIGGTMAIKPSAMKSLERLANHWVSTRKAMQPLEKPCDSLDIWVGMYPRLFGAIVTVASLYNLTLMLYFLLGRTA